MARRLLHTSDVHIGTTFRRATGDHRATCVCPVLAILHAADHHDVDAILIAGDLFDHARLPDDVMGEVLDLLNGAGRPVVLMPGNHDVHDETSLWHRTEVGDVHLLDDPDGATIALFPDLHVWGKAMDEHTREYRPLHGVGERPAEAAFVVMGHGFYDDTEGYRSSPITDDDIAATSADYVALGHVHVAQDLSVDGVAAWYSGAPTGVSQQGTFNLVTIGVGTAVKQVEVPLPADGCAVDAIEEGS